LEHREREAALVLSQAIQMAGSIYLGWLAGASVTLMAGLLPFGTSGALED
jgi:hypothetical protein